MNSSRGVLSCPDISMCSEEEITEECSSQGVTHVKRFTRKKDGMYIPTNSYIFTFNQPNLPKDIKLGYLNCKIKPYIPSPLRCFHCQKFGHTKPNCRRRLETCARCSTEGHGDASCVREFKCVNCLGNHPSFSKNCVRYKDECEVQKIKTVDKLSYFEARTLYENRYGIKLNATYAEAVIGKTKPKSISISTQTDTSNNIPITSALKITIPNIVTTNKPATSNQQPFERTVIWLGHQPMLLL
jgi:hypothetical protein